MNPKNWKLNHVMLIIGVFSLLAGGCKKEDDQFSTEERKKMVMDIEGNFYRIDTIGEQVWMVENLKTTKYRNGDPIQKVMKNNEWAVLQSGAYCDCNNDPALGSRYGRLYNWMAVNDARNIAPEGWHVATDDDWVILENYISENYGVLDSLAKPLAAQIDWEVSDVPGNVGNEPAKNNISGFNGLPAGNRSNDGFYGFPGYECAWWTGTNSSKFNAWGRTLKYDNFKLERGNFGMKCGFSVRCVKN